MDKPQKTQDKFPKTEKFIIKPTQSLSEKEKQEKQEQVDLTRALQRLQVRTTRWSLPPSAHWIGYYD